MRIRIVKRSSYGQQILTIRISPTTEIIVIMRIDFTMISEAGQIGHGQPPCINGFTYFRAEDKRLTRGSVMYVRNDSETQGT